MTDVEILQKSNELLEKFDFQAFSKNEFIGAYILSLIETISTPNSNKFWIQLEDGASLGFDTIEQLAEIIEKDFYRPKLTLLKAPQVTK